MKLWHGILLGVGLLMITGGLLAVVLPIDNPKYAPGEACAMVERIYHWDSSDLYEEYLGQGIWEVKSLTIYEVYYPIPESPGHLITEDENGFFEFEKRSKQVPNGDNITVEEIEELLRQKRKVREPAARGQAIFRVYETTNTVQPYNNMARLLVKD